MPVLDKLARILPGAHGGTAPDDVRAPARSASPLSGPPLSMPNGSSKLAAEPRQHHLPAAHYTPGSTSSCQLFGLFKAMAAGSSGQGSEVGADDVDSDEDEDGPLTIAQRRSRTRGPSGDDEPRADAVEVDEDARTVTGVPDATEAAEELEDGGGGGGGAERRAQRRWMSDTVGGDSRLNETLSSRFAALSMSNFSPLAEAEQGRRRAAAPARARPPLPTFAEQDDLVPSPESMSDDEGHGAGAPSADAAHAAHDTDDSASTASASTGMTTPSVAPASAAAGGGDAHDDISDEEKLGVIIQEFGDIASSMVNPDGTPSEPERLLAEAKGSLFKGVMMIGNLHLTTHRLLFHALLPPDEVFVTHKPELAAEIGADMDDQSFEAARARAARPDIIQAGPVTVHDVGLFKTRRRVWFELSRDMITSYPSADEAGRVRPLVTVLLSSCLRLDPLDEDNPCDFHFTYEAGNGGIRSTHFTVDTEQSASNWRRQIEGAMFRHARLKFRKRHREAARRIGALDESLPNNDEGTEWTMMRCCVPLDRATVTGVSEYHSFATLVALDIMLDDHATVTWLPEEMPVGQGTQPLGAAEHAPASHAPAPHAGDKDKPRGLGHTLPALREASSDLLRRPHSPSTATGSATPKRTFSLSGALPFRGRDRDKGGEGSGSRTATPPARSETPPAAQPAREDRHRPHRQSTQWLDSQLPQWLGSQLPRVAGAGQSTDDSSSTSGGACGGVAGAGPTPAAFKPGADWRNSFTFTVAVLNEQSWFATALDSAVRASRARMYRPGAPKSAMRLDVGGYDCLAADDELEREDRERAAAARGDGVRRTDSQASGSSAVSGTPARDTSDSDDEDGAAHGVAIAIRRSRKEEKAAMAAKLFGLREDEGIWLKRCYVSHGLVPDRGHIILTPRYICFWRRATVGSDIKYRFSLADVKSAEPHSASMAGFHGMALKLHGQHDLQFEFWKEGSRDEVIRRITTQCQQVDAETQSPLANAAALPTAAGSAAALSDSAPAPARAPSISGGSVSPSVESVFTAPLTLAINPEAECGAVKSGEACELDQAKARGARRRGVDHHAADILAPARDTLLEARAFPDEALSFMPFIANKPMGLTRLAPRTFALLTIGSRGDVQPYIALAIRLMRDGHKVVIITHDEFKKWIEGYGIEHRQAGGDPTALMRLSTEHKMFSPGFFKESLGSFRQWLDDLLLDAWNACHDADVLIESPSAMAGVHIAEARRIPYFRAFTMPWTRTTAYPQAFMVPAFEMGPSFNYSTYVLFDNIMWRATAGQINRWRRTHLGLGNTDMTALSVTKVPFLYNFSPAVVPKPLDWHDDITITGYWTLDDSDTEWTPPPGLVEFMDRARADGKALVYIGFGSIVVPRPNAMTKSIIKAVEKADVRAIIAKGWSSRGGDPAHEGEHIALPPSCFGLDKAPHAWLFPKVDAALHHGGAGTVGASLRAGIPTLIKPWFGDQHFWAGRVQKLEVGLKVGSLKSDEIAAALVRATTDRVMREKAARVGERVRAENGVDEAVRAIQFNIVRAAADRRKMAWAK